MLSPLLIATTQGVLISAIMIDLVGVLLLWTTWTSLSQKYTTYRGVRYNRDDDPLFYWFLTALSFGIEILCTVLGVVFTIRLIQSSGLS